MPMHDGSLGILFAQRQVYRSILSAEKSNEYNVCRVLIAH